MSQVFTCFKCGAENSIKAVYCHHCGINLRDLPGSEDETMVVRPDDDDAMMNSLHDRRAYFGRDNRLALQVIGTDDLLMCDLSNLAVTLGRGQVESNYPHISLSDYKASDYGVSREHVRISRMNFTLLVEDMGALNGTYINGERIQPRKPCVLCDGDELRLANMPLEVIFQKRN